MLTKILVPLDGTLSAERALPFATRLSAATGARLSLIAAAPDGDGPRLPAERAAVRSKRQDEEWLTAVAGRLQQEGLAVEAHICDGGAVQTIVQAAESEEVGLVVMATHARSGMDRWIHGSVADQVVRQASAPVLLVPPACEDPWPTDRAPRVLVPLDSSALAEAALGPALELAGALGAEVHLLRVVEQVGPAQIAGTPVDLPNAADVEEAMAYVAGAEATDLVDARRYLDGVASAVRATGVVAGVHVAAGRAAEVIPAFAREDGADLIALATHGRGGLARLMLGSVAATLLQTAHVPLLLVRPHPVGVEAGPPTPIYTEDVACRVVVPASPEDWPLMQQGLELRHGHLERSSGIPREP